MYPVEDNSIQNIPYWMAIGHIDAVFIIRMITNDYIWTATLRNIDTRSYNTKSLMCVLSMPGAIYFAWNFIESTNSCDVCYYFMYHTNFPSVIKKICEPSVFYF